jgi:hypothetical protein
MALTARWNRLDEEQRFAVAMIGLSVLVFLAVWRSERDGPR